MLSLARDLLGVIGATAFIATAMGWAVILPAVFQSIGG